MILLTLFAGAGAVVAIDVVVGPVFVGFAAQNVVAPFGEVTVIGAVAVVSLVLVAVLAIVTLEGARAVACVIFGAFAFEARPFMLIGLLLGVVVRGPALIVGLGVLVFVLLTLVVLLLAGVVGIAGLGLHGRRAGGHGHEYGHAGDNWDGFHVRCSRRVATPAFRRGYGLGAVRRAALRFLVALMTDERAPTTESNAAGVDRLPWPPARP